MCWTELPRAEALISASCLAQCLANSVCLIGAVENRASFIKNKAHHLVSHSTGAPVPRSWVTGSLWSVDPWGCLAGSNELLLLALKTVLRTIPAAVIQLHFRQCDAHQSIPSHHPAASPAVASSNPLPSGSSTTQFDLGSMPLCIKDASLPGSLPSWYGMGHLYPGCASPKCFL